MPSSKLMKVPEAVELVKDGDELTISGMTFFRNPMMFIAALLKGGRKGPF